MPLDIKVDDNIKFPSPDFLSLGNFKRGVITLTNESKLPKNALAQADNCFLVEDGQPSPRPGMQWYGTTPLLPTPGSFTLSAATGSSLGVGVYQYRVTFVNAQGETLASSPVSITTTTGNTSVYVGSFGVDNLPIGPGGTTARNIYRTKVGGSTFYKLVQIGNNIDNFYHDITPDSSLTVAGTPSTNTAKVGSIDGFNYFDNQGAGSHLVVVADGNVFRSLDDGTTWTLCTGDTLTTGLHSKMEQYNAYLYMATGNDLLARYDGSTSLQVYTTLTTPSAPTIAKTGMAGTTYTLYYKISAVSQIGFTAASTTGTIQTDRPRDQFDSTANYVTLTLPAPQTAQTRYDIYFSEDNVNFYYLDSLVSSIANPQVTYVDKGAAFITPTTVAPLVGTTQGPTVGDLATVGNRLFACQDKNNPYRIWYSSGTSPFGSFSDGYDGGYLDYQIGGKFFPTKVEDYRDGKGTNIATVWCNSADGQGCIIQMTLNTVTVGNLSVTVPSAYRLPGSRGTPAPWSVINVLNDYYFYNTLAFYSLGNRPNLLQILSTDELSANIRPTIKTINPLAESKIVAEYYDAKVYISAPYGSSTDNNATLIYDTELQAWLPKAYDKGFKQFLRYTSSDGVHHLLAVKPGDNQLTELGTLYTKSATIQGDYGVPFNTELLTGLYSTAKDRYGFQYTQEMEYEFNNPNGTINIELLGVDHARGFTSVKTAILNIGATNASDAGWGSFGWDVDPWDDTAITPSVLSEVSAKRYTVVNRELNAVQWHISTNTLDAGYILRSLQTWGTDTEDAHPSKWRITAS